MSYLCSSQRNIKTSLYIDEKLYGILREKSIKEQRTLSTVLNRVLENGLKREEGLTIKSEAKGIDNGLDQSKR